jgi:hypothetical protein
MKLFKLLIFSIYLIVTYVSGQFSSSIEVSTLYDNNVFRSPYQYEDLLTDFDVDVSYQFSRVNLDIYYNPEFIIYRDYSDRNFSMHSVGINYAKEFGTEEQHTFFLGGNYLMRLNGSSYESYDFNQLYTFTSIRFDLNWIFLKTGYNFRYRYYLDADYANLNNYRHNLFAQINKSFPSRTSLIVEVNLGKKSFEGIRSYTIYESYKYNPPADGGDGDGGGKGPDGRGGNYLVNISSLTSTTAAEVTTVEPPDLNQLVLITRIAQSIMPRMGIYLQYRRQTSLTDQTSYLNADAYFQDEELFDDPFSYQSEDLSSQLSWMLPASVKLQIGGGMTSKEYISEQAFISELDSTGLGGFRSDDVTFIHFSISKAFKFKKSWLYSLVLSVNYNYQRNESNSFWYNYKNSFYSFGINWNL